MLEANKTWYKNPGFYYIDVGSFSKYIVIVPNLLLRTKLLITDVIEVPKIPWCYGFSCDLATTVSKTDFTLLLDT